MFILFSKGFINLVSGNYVKEVDLPSSERDPKLDRR